MATKKTNALPPIEKQAIKNIREQQKKARAERVAQRFAGHKCRRCGRPLRTVLARKTGYGPTCAKLQQREDTHRELVRTLDQTNRYNPTLFQHEMPKFHYDIVGDVIIITDEGGATAVLQNMEAVLGELNKQNLVVDNARHFLFLVCSPSGYYDGLIPDESAGRAFNGAPLRFTLVPMAESDRKRAIKKLQLAFQLGPDVNPAM